MLSLKIIRWVHACMLAMGNVPGGSWNRVVVMARANFSGRYLESAGMFLWDGSFTSTSLC